MINTFKTIFESRQDKFQQESVFHGECVDLVGTIVTDGVPNTLQYYEAHGIYQPSETTSGDVWYPVSTSISGNSVVLHWTPANEIPGYDNYTIYCLVEKVGDTSYPLTWKLNLAKSPGYPAHPVDPIPEQLDFSKYELLNAPWLSATETDTSWIVNKVIQVPGLEVSAVSAQDIVIDQGSLYDKITGLDDKIDGVSGDLLGLSGDFSDCCSGLNDKLDGMSETIDGRFETVNDNIAAFNEPISTIIDNTDGLDEQLYSIKSDTDGLQESIPAIQSTLDNSDYGLNAIRNAVDSINLDTSNLATSAQATAIQNKANDIYGVVNNASYGNSGILNQVRDNWTTFNNWCAEFNRLLTSYPTGLLYIQGTMVSGFDATNAKIDGLDLPTDYAKESTVNSLSGTTVSNFGTVNGKLDNSSYGLQKIKQAVDAITIPTDYAKANALAAVKAVVDENNAHLENPNYGLEAIDTVTTQINNRLVDATNGLAAIKGTVAESNIMLKDQNYGLAALKSGLNGLNSNLNGVNSNVVQVQNRLDNSTYGLQKIKQAVDAIDIPTDYAKQNTLLAASGTMVSGVEAIRNDIANIDIDIPSDYAKQLTLTSGVEAIRQDIANIDFDTSDLATSAQAQTIISYLEAPDSGLPHIGETVDSINGMVSDIDGRTQTLATTAQVSGVSADILSLSGDFSQCCTNLTTKMNVVSAGVADIQDSLGNPTYGLASIYGALDSIGSNVNNINQLAIGSHGFDALAYDISQLSNDLYNVYYSVYDSYQKESVVYIAGVNRGLLQNGTYGLEAIKNKLNTTDTHATSAANRSYDNYSLLTNGTYGLEAIKGFAYDAVDVGGDIYSIVNNGTYGNSAIKTKLNTTDSHATSAAQQAKNAYDILNNGTYGNSAIKTKLDTTDTHATSGAQLAKSNNDLIRTVSANIGTEYSQLGYNSLSDMCSTILNNEGVIIDNPYFGLSTIKGNLVAASGDMVSGFNAVNGYLTNGTYGLNAIKTKLDSTYTQAANANTNAGNAAVRSLNAYNIVNNGTYGNSAIKTKLDTTDTHATSAANQAALANTFAAANNVVLTNQTYGLPAIKNVADLTYTEASNAYAAANTTYSYVSDNGYGLPAIKNAIDAISIPSDYAKQTTLVSVSGDLRTDYLSVSGMLGDVAAALDIINGEVL